MRGIGHPVWCAAKTVKLLSFGCSYACHVPRGACWSVETETDQEAAELEQHASFRAEPPDGVRRDRAGRDHVCAVNDPQRKTPAQPCAHKVQGACGRARGTSGHPGHPTSHVTARRGHVSLWHSGEGSDVGVDGFTERNVDLAPSRSLHAPAPALLGAIDVSRFCSGKRAARYDRVQRDCARSCGQPSTGLEKEGGGGQTFAANATAQVPATGAML